MEKVWVEIWSELFVLVLSYHMFLYTDYVIDVSVNFALGLSFVFTLVGMLLLNVCNMVRNSIKRVLSERRKKKV